MADSPSKNTAKNTAKNAAKNTEYDAIVVGSGPGGCVVARRLADNGQRVALIEAAAAAPLPQSLRGLSAVGGTKADSWVWPSLAIGYGGRSHDEPLVRFPYRQGRALGGGSAINSMVLSPGDEQDYRRWQTVQRCVDWGHETMAPWLGRAVESLPRQIVAAGPLTNGVMSVLSRELLGANTGAGKSSIEPGATGVVDAVLASHHGRRHTTFDALVGSASASNALKSAHPSIELIASTTVSRVVVDRGVATGVETECGQSFRAKNTILAAGAIGSPRLLNASIGGLDNIGRSIVDHPSFAFAVSSQSEQVVDHQAPSAVSKIFRFASGGDESTPGDIQVLVIENIQGHQPAGVSGEKVAGGGDTVLSVVVVTLLTPNSTGQMNFGADSSLEITRGCLTTSTDRVRFRTGVRRVATTLVEQTASDLLSEVLIDDHGTPATKLLRMSDDDLDQWLLHHPGPIAHLAAGCRMGPSPESGAVTSSSPATAGQVFGATGLYVADSSVLPGLTSGGLQIPVMAVSDRIASAING